MELRWDSTLHPQQKLKLTKPTTANVVKDVEQVNLSSITDGSEKSYNFEKLLLSFLQS